MWIVVNIGCIECGVSSGIVGIFTEEAEAQRIASHLDDVASWREGGQNSYEVFKAPLNDLISPDYRDYFK